MTRHHLPEWDDQFFGTCADHGLFPIELTECPSCRCVQSEEEMEDEE